MILLQNHLKYLKNIKNQYSLTLLGIIITLFQAKFNFFNSSVQDQYSFESSDLRRNTDPLNLIEEDSEYPYIFIPNKLNQTVTVTSTAPGTVNGVGIVTAGDGYNAGESLLI